MSAPGPQYSPDGRFWWDGSAWRPVEQAPGQAAGPPAPGTGPTVPPPPPHAFPLLPPRPGAPGGPGAAGGPPPPAPSPGWGAPRPARTGSSLVAQLIVTILVCALPGALGGFVLANVTAPDPQGPTAPPAIPANFPNKENRILPGVTVSMVADEWLKQANSYTCEETEPPGGGVDKSMAPHAMECSAPGDAKYDLYVDIAYDNENEVREVEATCNYDPGAIACSSLFANLADLAFVAQPELRKKAADWAEKHTDTDDTTVLGGVRLIMSLEHPHSLRVIPEPGQATN